MPQPEMFEPARDVMGIRLQIDTEDYNPDTPTITTIMLRRRNAEWSALLSQRWTGIEKDFLVTWATDVYIAYAFQDARAILAAASSTHRAAKRHARSHAFD